MIGLVLYMAMGGINELDRVSLTAGKLSSLLGRFITHSSSWNCFLGLSSLYSPSVPSWLSLLTHLIRGRPEKVDWETTPGGFCCPLMCLAESQTALLNNNFNCFVSHSFYYVENIHGHSDSCDFSCASKLALVHILIKTSNTGRILLSVYIYFIGNIQNSMKGAHTRDIRETSTVLGWKLRF